MKTVTVDTQNVVVTDNGACWTIPAGQVDKHRAMFAAELDALPKAEADKLSGLLSAERVKAGR